MAKISEKAVEQNNANSDPIGTPPSGGNWTWDVASQQWIEVVAQESVKEVNQEQAAE